MKRWIKTGLLALALGFGIALPAHAAEVSVQLDNVSAPVQAAQLRVYVSGSSDVAFKSDADGAAVRVEETASGLQATLYVADKTSMTSGNRLILGTLTVDDGAAVIFEEGSLTLWGPGLGAPLKTDGINVSLEGSTSGGGSVDRTPQVSVDGAGGTAKAHRDGSVTITPDTGYRIAEILVNGEPVEITTKLTGLSAKDKVVVRFEKLPDTATDLPFIDVSADQWYYEAVCYAYEHGLMAGTASDQFAPNTTTTRGMIVTILHRLEGAPSAESAGFDDVAEGAWYAESVNWAAANGVVNGYGDGRFGPEDVITREQFAAILQNYAAYKGVDISARADLSGYADASAVSDWAYDALSWANAEGLIGGMSATELAPRGSATRAQAAAILMRYCETIMS